MGFLFTPERFGRGMFNFLAMLHQAGVTTALDMGTGIYGNPAGEIAGVRAAANAYPVPVRLILTPIIVDFLTRGKSPEEALEEIRGWQNDNDDRVMVGNHFKLMIDGAIFSGLAQMGPPGYLDGHEGVWMVPEPVLKPANSNRRMNTLSWTTSQTTTNYAAGNSFSFWTEFWVKPI